MVALALGCYGMIVALAWGFQNRLVWFPGPPAQATPAAIGVAFEEVTIGTSDGVQLHAWFMPGPSEAPVVLVSHGNAGTIADRLLLASAFLEMGAGVLMYDYRGYGSSGGVPSEEGTYRDADAAFDWLAARGVPPARVVAYGESLGGAVAIALATRRPVAALIVEATFSTLADVGARAYPWLPVRQLSRIHYDNLSRAPTIDIPVLVIHSPQDDLIPIAMAERLYAAFPGPKDFMRTGGAHNAGGFLQQARWQARVAGFLEQVQ